MNEIVQDVRQKIAAHWDTTITRKHSPIRWINFPFIHRQQNIKICGEAVDKPASYGLTRVMVKQLNGRVLREGVSIGGGSGYREMELLEQGIVEHFTVYDLAPARIEKGREFAQKKGLTAKIDFRCEDGMASTHKKYDLVYWHAALHHMFDTPKAVEWSWESLNPGGFFWALEYTGPSKVHYTEEMLAWATAIRRMFPKRYTGRLGKFAPVHIPVPRPHPERTDPSEAADSERILPAINRVIPNAQIWPLGGVGYFIAFSNMAPRFDPKSKEDEEWIAAMLAIDDRLSDMGLNIRHAILAQKP